MNNVTALKIKGNTGANQVLSEALKDGYSEVIVVGWKGDGPEGEFSFDTNITYGSTALWLLSAAERTLWLKWDNKN